MRFIGMMAGLKHAIFYPGGPFTHSRAGIGHKVKCTFREIVFNVSTDIAVVIPCFKLMAYCLEVFDILAVFGPVERVEHCGP